MKNWSLRTKKQFLDPRHTSWLLYVNGISHEQKPIVKISGGGDSPPEPCLE